MELRWFKRINFGRRTYERLLFVGVLSLFTRCQHPPPNTHEESLVLAMDSSKVSHSEILNEELSDSLWIDGVIRKWYVGLTDTSLRPIHLIQAPSRQDYRQHVIVCEQALCALSYMRDGHFMRISYLPSNEITVHALWYKQELIFTEEYCFNDSWGRCGVGFRRTMVYRAGRMIYERYNTSASDTKEDFEADACNCMQPLDFQNMRLLRQKCLVHARAQRSDR